MVFVAIKLLFKIVFWHCFTKIGFSTVVCQFILSATFKMLFSFKSKGFSFVLKYPNFSHIQFQVRNWSFSFYSRNKIVTKNTQLYTFTSKWKCQTNTKNPFENKLFSTDNWIFFFPGDTSFWRNTYFQMPFEGLLVQIHSINRVKILEKKSHTYTDVALSPSVRKK